MTNKEDKRRISDYPISQSDSNLIAALAFIAFIGTYSLSQYYDSVDPGCYSDLLRHSGYDQNQLTDLTSLSDQGAIIQKLIQDHGFLTVILCHKVLGMSVLITAIFIFYTVFFAYIMKTRSLILKDKKNSYQSSSNGEKPVRFSQRLREKQQMSGYIEQVSEDEYERQANQVTQEEVDKLYQSKQYQQMRRQKGNKIEKWNWQYSERKNEEQDNMNEEEQFSGRKNTPSRKRSGSARRSSSRRKSYFLRSSSKNE